MKSGRILLYSASPFNRRWAAFAPVAETFISLLDPPRAPKTGEKRPSSPQESPELHDKGRHLAPQRAWARVVACASQGELNKVTQGESL